MTGVGLGLLVWLCLPGWAAEARPSRPQALDVLRRALEPPRESYAGEITISRRAADGQSAATRMSVRFRPPNLYRHELLGRGGKLRLLVVEDGVTEWIYEPARNAVRQGGQAEPWFKRFGPDEEFELLAGNFDVAMKADRAAGRRCWKLELRSRPDGALVRRLWVDQAGGLLLRSEAYGEGGEKLESMRFSKVSFGASSPDALFEFSPPEGVAVRTRAEPDYLALEEAKAAGIEPRLPAWLPAGFVFESLDVVEKGRRKLVHYRFSDGVRALSLFQCPARLRLDFGARGRKRVKLASGRGWLARGAEGAVLSWAA
ncbi:MAG: sigma-E factor regulatory protein RseB domain-containing protein, partial [Elusimicrobia bacterium]|nr:sigma-E factor regulatory protein RseB domain-containing protein [Elusimicrobiota bacterium]